MRSIYADEEEATAKLYTVLVLEKRRVARAYNKFVVLPFPEKVRRNLQAVCIRSTARLRYFKNSEEAVICEAPVFASQARINDLSTRTGADEAVVYRPFFPVENC